MAVFLFRTVSPSGQSDLVPIPPGGSRACFLPATIAPLGDVVGREGADGSGQTGTRGT